MVNIAKKGKSVVVVCVGLKTGAAMAEQFLAKPIAAVMFVASQVTPVVMVQPVVILPIVVAAGQKSAQPNAAETSVAHPVKCVVMVNVWNLHSVVTGYPARPNVAMETSILTNSVTTGITTTATGAARLAQ